jgi:hypothetical protein
MLGNQENVFDVYLQQGQFTLYYLPFQHHRCNNFQYFGQSIEKLSGKNTYGLAFPLVVIHTYPPYDADPAGSGSGTLGITILYYWL